MIERGDRRRLPLEPPPELGVPGVGFAQHLDRDRDLEPGMEASIDHAHSAASELGLDRKPTEMVH